MFNLEVDAEEFIDQQNEVEKCPNPDWSALFNPDAFALQKDSLICETYKLDESTIMSFAKELTVVRSKLLELTEKA